MWNFYKVDYILDKLQNAINNKVPFSLIRFGDGGLKLIYYFLTDEKNELRKISEKEGIPLRKMREVLEAWRFFANSADFIDSPQCYFEGFWDRYKLLGEKRSKKSYSLLRNWDIIYSLIGIENKNFCNPEINFLSILNFKNNLFDLLKNRKICCITNHDNIQNFLNISGIEVEVIKIVGWYQNHFDYFKETIDKINNYINMDFDLFLIGAGELGRIYTGYIKFLGGRAFDLGSVFDFWVCGTIPLRLKIFLEIDPDNTLMVKLSEDRREYIYNIFQNPEFYFQTNFDNLNEQF